MATSPPAPIRTFLSVLTGSFAQPAAENPTVAMIEAGYRHHGIDARYLNCEVSPSFLPDAVRGARAMGWVGFNCSIPHKVAVHASCDELTDVAERVGAVNTFWFESGRLHGDNTDVGGFDAAARALLGGETAGARIVVLGCGGAAAAVIAAAEQWADSQVAIVARSSERASKLARRFRDVARVEKSVELALADATLIVNATPVGQREAEQPLDVGIIPKTVAVMDLVYRRGGDTPWVKAARKRGNPAADGLPMLLEQGALSFQRWFGIEPDREVMRQSLL